MRAMTSIPEFAGDALRPGDPAHDDEFEFRLHPIDGWVLFVDLSFDLDVAVAPLRAWRELLADAPELKRQYDPDNVFRLNQNIRPAPADRA